VARNPNEMKLQEVFFHFTSFQTPGKLKNCSEFIFCVAQETRSRSMMEEDYKIREASDWDGM
jgi:hypothetical protein